MEGEPSQPGSAAKEAPPSVPPILVTSPVTPTSDPLVQEPKVPEDVLMRRRVFVGNVARSCTNEFLLNALKELISGVEHVNIIRERENDISKGYGFVTFASEEQAQACMVTKNVTVQNRVLNFGPAKRKDKKFEDHHHNGGPRRPASYAAVSYVENNGYAMPTYVDQTYPPVFGYPEEYPYYDSGYPGLHNPQFPAYQEQYLNAGGLGYDPRVAEGSVAGQGHNGYRGYRTPNFYPPPTHSPAYSNLSPGSVYSASPRDGGLPPKFVFPVAPPGHLAKPPTHDKGVDSLQQGMHMFSISQQQGGSGATQ